MRIENSRFQQGMTVPRRPSKHDKTTLQAIKTQVQAVRSRFSDDERERILREPLDAVLIEIDAKLRSQRYKGRASL